MLIVPSFVHPEMAGGFLALLIALAFGAPVFKW